MPSMSQARPGTPEGHGWGASPWVGPSTGPPQVRHADDFCPCLNIYTYMTPDLDSKQWMYEKIYENTSKFTKKNAQNDIKYGNI